MLLQAPHEMTAKQRREIYHKRKSTNKLRKTINKKLKIVEKRLFIYDNPFLAAHSGHHGLNSRIMA
jgi:hypothetical protein